MGSDEGDERLTVDVCLCMGFLGMTGNKAAAVRARKALQDLKTLAQELRVAIQRCKSESAHARLMEQQDGQL